MFYCSIRVMVFLCQYQAYATVVNINLGYNSICTILLNHLKTGFPRSGKSQGKIKKVQGQGKVREFCFWSGKFEILAKVREKSGNFRIKSQTLFFSDDNYSYKSINSNDFQLLGEL